MTDGTEPNKKKKTHTHFTYTHIISSWGFDFHIFRANLTQPNDFNQSSLQFQKQIWFWCEWNKMCRELFNRFFSSPKFLIWKRTFFLGWENNWHIYSKHKSNNNSYSKWLRWVNCTHSQSVEYLNALWKKKITKFIDFISLLCVSLYFFFGSAK